MATKTAASALVTTLKGGAKMPLLGFACSHLQNAADLRNTLVTAVQIGYRKTGLKIGHQHQNVFGETLENDIFGRKLVKRDELFLVTKFQSSSNLQDAVNKHLTALRLQYVDLGLIEYPKTEVQVEEAWAGMEGLSRSGLVRSIGVTNCNAKQIARILANCQIRPAVNQIEEIHLARQIVGLVQFCRHADICPITYSRLDYEDSPEDREVLNKPLFVQLAAKYNVKPAQIIIRWLMQRGVGVVIKALCLEHLKNNKPVNDEFELSNDEAAAIAKMIGVPSSL